MDEPLDSDGRTEWECDLKEIPFVHDPWTQRAPIPESAEWQYMQTLGQNAAYDSGRCQRNDVDKEEYEQHNNEHDKEPTEHIESQDLPWANDAGRPTRALVTERESGTKT